MAKKFLVLIQIFGNPRNWVSPNQHFTNTHHKFMTAINKKKVLHKGKMAYSIHRNKLKWKENFSLLENSRTRILYTENTYFKKSWQNNVT